MLHKVRARGDTTHRDMERVLITRARTLCRATPLTPPHVPLTFASSSFCRLVSPTRFLAKAFDRCPQEIRAPLAAAKAAALRALREALPEGAAIAAPAATGGGTQGSAIGAGGALLASSAARAQMGRKEYRGVLGGSRRA